MIHSIYEYGIICSKFYEKLIPVLEKLDVKALVRIKANLYPNSEELHEHEAHTDTKYPHMAAILYINTCNGYTKLEDCTKIDSVANRILLFDPNKPHTPSTTTDQPVRVNININYF